MARKRLHSYDQAEREILDVLGEIKRNSEDLRKLVEERLEVERGNREKKASQ